MWIDRLFRKEKAGQTIDYKAVSDGCRIIGDGVLFEGDGIFVKWGTPVTDLPKEVAIKKEPRADRVIYHFGERTILGGLKLRLVAVFWNSFNEPETRDIYTVEYLSIGDKDAGQHLNHIRKHLEDKFGEPVVRETADNDVSLRWKSNGAQLSLYYFERHSNKLHLQMEKI